MLLPDGIKHSNAVFNNLEPLGPRRLFRRCEFVLLVIYRISAIRRTGQQA